jgi:hypothetical protein
VESRSAKATVRVPCDVSIDEAQTGTRANLQSSAVSCDCSRLRGPSRACVDDGAAAPERALAFAELLTWPPAFLDKVKNYLAVALGASRRGRAQDLPNQVPGTKQRAAHLKDVTFKRRIP